jgi:putative ABC transport system permease protein
MLNYYAGLAFRSLTHNLILSVLMITIIGVGIGASMTVLAVFRAMSADPIPQKSHELFAPQIDNWGPFNQQASSNSRRADGLEDQLSYRDAMALLRSHTAKHQTLMFKSGATFIPSGNQLQPFAVAVRATNMDFFTMFEVPFLYGNPWTSADDEEQTPVAVITRELNDKLFGGANSIGKTMNLDNQEYRVVGVLKDWRPVPRFYDLNGDRFGEVEQVFIPFSRAIANKMDAYGDVKCVKGNGGWDTLLQSECVWIQFWAEIPTFGDLKKYQLFLGNYASDQQQSGRFLWAARTQLRDVDQWLKYERVVPDDARIMVAVSFSFLCVCLLNAMGLMLARIMRRKRDIATRRALGASRAEIFSQYLVEVGLTGLLGGVLGLILTGSGLVGARALFSSRILEVTHLDLSNVVTTMLLALLATIAAGLYPTWRAVRVHPASQLRSQ